MRRELTILSDSGPAYGPYIKTVETNVALRTARRSLLAIIAAACLLPGVAWGLINPNFTPIHLTDGSDLILLAKAVRKDNTDSVELTVLGVLKGKAPAKLVVDLSQAPKEHAKATRQRLAGTFGQTVMLFGGKYQDERIGYLHVQGQWLRLAYEKGAWIFEVIDDEMAGTWNGGTDMLERCVRYILKNGGDATVPIVSGTAWRSIAKVGAVKGKVTGIAAVDLAGDGKLALHVSSAGGDVLLKPTAGAEGFVDVTAKAKLTAKSLAAAWGDFNGDGRMDLASFDGKGLTIFSANADGTFTAAKAGGNFTISPKCTSLKTIGLGKAATPGLVAGGAAVPVVLAPAGKGAFKAVGLPKSKTSVAKWGKPQGPLVGDFNNDAIPDIILPFEKGGMLHLGKADGTFQAGTACGVNCTEGGGMGDLGDFDGDGWMDAMTCGADGVRVWQNLQNGKFVETLGLSGEMSYKAQ
ncbi:hypothetical protein LCGC14_1104490, partial [marine sediment metagenome]